MNEQASHAASAERRYRVSTDLEREARGLFGKHPDAIQAQLVIHAAQEITAKDEGVTRQAWIASFALARATTMLAWAFNRIERLELEAAGQESLFDPDPDDA
jgi:hypothetical protein